MGELVEAIFPFFRRFAVEVILLTLALGIAVASFSFIFDKADAIPAEMPSPQPSLTGTDKIQAVVIEVAGAVNAAGVYEMQAGSRLKDALTEAGGLSDDADREYFSRNFNQARYLSDQEKIYIPTAQEVSVGIFTERKQSVDYLTPQTSAAAPLLNQAGTISINTAEAAELESLPGVGKATAAKIIQLRPYNSIDELSTKQAVKKNVFEQIKNLVSL